MKSILLILLLITLTSASAQTKYFIYMKDKGIKQGETLRKLLPAYSEAINNLTERAIQRRNKVKGTSDIISYEDLPLKEEYKSALRGEGVEIIRELTWLNAVSAFLDQSEFEKISSLPFVLKVEPVRSIVFKEDEVEDKTMLKQFEGELNYGPSYTQMFLSDIPQVHKKGFTGEGVLIGFLDTGFDWRDHESLVNRDVIAEYDFIFNDDNTADEPEDAPGQHSHGTSVFSVAAGYMDSMLIGPAFNSSFLLAKTEDIRSERRVEEDNYAAALIWMENQGVDITTSSVGYNEFEGFSYTYADMNGNTAVVTKAVNVAFEKGVVTVTAAGNEGNSPWKYIIAPADARDIISVGSVSSSNTVAGSSGRGPTSDGRIKPEVVAMGVSVFAASHTGFTNYGFTGGTSLAAPIAAGTAALLLSAHPHLTNRQVRSIILETAGNASSPDNNRGYGLISALSAVSYPNLQITDQSTILHKIFADDNLNPASVKLYTAAGTGEFIEVNMSNSSSVYTAVLPDYSQGTNVKFYFSYVDSVGIIQREPASGNYRYEEGSLLVNLNVESGPTDYVLSQNYPNPFNSSTTIKFKAPAVEKAELVIIDAAGQKVKVLFDGMSEQGVNMVSWDGTADRGYKCASGVYYYVLKLGGSEYGKKMILLK